MSYLANALHRLWNSDHSYRRPDVINLFAILLFAVIGIFYGINPEFARLRSDFARLSSFMAFGISIAFYYYTAVLSYDKPKSVGQSLEAKTDVLGARLEALRQEQDPHP